MQEKRPGRHPTERGMQEKRPGRHPTERGMQEKRPGRHPTERGMQEKRPGCQPTERGYARDMRGICASHTLEPSIIVDSELKQGPPRFPGPHQSACFCSAIVSKHILGHENIYYFILPKPYNFNHKRTEFLYFLLHLLFNSRIPMKTLIFYQQET